MTTFQNFDDGPGQQNAITSSLDHGLEQGAQLAEKYVVRALLGRGGMGEVYLVEDPSSGALRAAKVMRAREDASVEDLQSFRGEALSLLDLGIHPFVVRLFEVHDHGRDTVLIMEYVAPESGCTSLQEYIDRTTDYTDSLLGIWAVEFCVGMEHALASGMAAHRDIKPANLLVGASPFLKISDFGLALAAARHPVVIGDRGSALTALRRFHSADGRAICGTPGYIAPEIFDGTGKAGVQSDMFSFGVTLWQLAARSPQMPFEVSSACDVSTFQQQFYQETLGGRLRTIDSPFFDVIRRCLDPEPAKRYSDFQTLREEIKAASKRHGLGAMDFLVNPGFRGTLDEHVSRARGYLVLGRRGRALRILDKALEHAPSSLAARLARGDVYLQRGDSARALRDFKAAHEQWPENDAPAIGMARAFLETGNLESAERVLAPVVARHPRNVEAQLQLASLLIRRVRYEGNSPLKAVVDGRVLYGVMSATCWSRPKPTRQARPSQ